MAGLLGGLAYGLAGGVVGGTEAAQPGLQAMEHGELQKQLNQQTSDLQVQAAQRIAEAKLAMEHGEQARVAGISTAGGTDMPGGSAPLAATSGNVPGFTAANPVPTSTASNPSLLGSAGAPVPAPATGLPSTSLMPTAPQPAAGAPGAGTPQPAGLGTTTGAVNPAPGEAVGDWLGRAQQRLVAAGLTDKAAELAKLSEYTIQGGGMFGQQILYNKQTGDYKVLNDQGKLRAATMEEIADANRRAKEAGYGQGLQEHQAKAQETYLKTINDPANAIGDWVTTGLDGKSMPHPVVTQMQRAASLRAFRASGQSDALGAIEDGRELTVSQMQAAEQDALKAGYTRGTPDFDEAKVRAFSARMRAKLSGQTAAKPGAAPAAAAAPGNPGQPAATANTTPQGAPGAGQIPL